MLADDMDDVLAKFKLVARGVAKKVYSDDKFSESKREKLFALIMSLNNEDLEPSFSESGVNEFFAEGILDVIESKLSNNSGLSGYIEEYLPCHGDIVVGDIVKFSQAVFEGSYPKVKYAGERINIAEIIKDSYGKDKQQHTFTIKILESTGMSPYKKDDITHIKGRNIYKDCKRKLWDDELKRDEVRNEKHERGSNARKLKIERRQGYNFNQYTDDYKNEIGKYK